MKLIDSLIKEKWLKTPRIIKAFKEIKRADFMAEDTKHLAELNEAMLIGYGQTISQPLVVAFMLEHLQPEPGQKILDIGSGSGWTTALLAYIISQQGNSKSTRSSDRVPGRMTRQILNSKGKVVAIELIPELKKFGEENVSKYNFIKKSIAEFVCADGSKGYKKEAPFDGILASASAQEIPDAWRKQLKINGKIVAPIKNSIWVFEKKSENQFKETEYPGFMFVPLV